MSPEAFLAAYPDVAAHLDRVRAVVCEVFGDAPVELYVVCGNELSVTVRHGATTAEVTRNDYQLWDAMDAAELTRNDLPVTVGVRRWFPPEAL